VKLNDRKLLCDSICILRNVKKLYIIMSGNVRVGGVGTFGGLVNRVGGTVNFFCALVSCNGSFVDSYSFGAIYWLTHFNVQELKQSGLIAYGIELLKRY